MDDNNSPPVDIIIVFVHVHVWTVEWDDGSQRLCMLCLDRDRDPSFDPIQWCRLI